MEKFRKTMVSIGGITFLFFGLFHMSFWLIFDWKTELLKLNLVNSNLMQMMNIGIIVMMLALGCVLLFFKRDILNSGLGKAVLFLSAIFFFVKLIAEFIYPGGSIALGAFLLICSLIYLVPAVVRVR